MARVVFRMQVNTGRADVGMAQVVPNHFQIRFSAQVTSGRVSHPMGRRLLQVRSRSLKLGTLAPQVSRTLPENGFDDFVDGTTGHGLDCPNQGPDQRRLIAFLGQCAESASCSVPNQFRHQFARGGYQPGFLALAGHLQPPAFTPVGATPAEESAHGCAANLRDTQATDIQQRKQPPAARCMQLFTMACSGHRFNGGLDHIPMLHWQKTVHACRGGFNQGSRQGRVVAYKDDSTGRSAEKCKLPICVH